VGNSGGLLTAPHGTAIDAHDAVMRINQAPVGSPYAQHAGGKSSFRLLNKKWVTVYSDKVYTATLTLTQVWLPEFQKLV
jgi:hypothetical protein